MLTCKQVTELASKAQDEPLTFKQRLQFRIHLLICSLCARYVKQLHFLKTAVKHIDTHATHSQLSEQSKQRIKTSLSDQEKRQQKYTDQ